MKFLRFTWKLLVMAAVFGVGYIVGREHSFEEEEQWVIAIEDGFVSIVRFAVR